jgi:copper chaperone CopZ|tara:strand:- start:398 stop:733 length:336 start_codon:yes stop_codon:yes gene_type:complete
MAEVNNVTVISYPKRNKKLAEFIGMPEMANIEIIPENEGEKLIIFDIEGVFCGSCGPSIEYDLRSITGVESVDRSGKRVFIVYNSNITSKDVIIASVHSPYSAKIISDEKI